MTSPNPVDSDSPGFHLSLTSPIILVCREFFEAFSALTFTFVQLEPVFAAFVLGFLKMSLLILILITLIQNYQGIYLQ